MTKEEYIKIRGGQEFPLSLAYEYYKDMSKGVLLSLEEFSQQFPVFLANYHGKAIPTKNGVSTVDLARVMTKVYDHFNQKFGL
ncbi:MAG: hypothetical protein WCP46_00320 [Alphaproteobacteria bacterium]